MTLKECDIEVGNVAYLRPSLLNSTPEIVIPKTPTPDEGRCRPFLCVECQADRSTWVPLTSSYRDERLLIPVGSRRGGDPRWMEEPVYVNDGATSYVGSNGAFISASRDERPFIRSRPSVSAAGVDEVKRAIRRRGGNLLDAA